ARAHQPGTRRAPGDLLPYPEVATRARRGTRGGAAGDAAVRPGPGARHLLLPSLPDLAADLLALVPHALALVRVGLAELAYVGRDFADLLLVDPLDHEPGGRLDPQRDPLRRGHRDRVAEPERELQALALRLHPVADPDDLQRLAVSLGDARDHVGDQRAGQPVQRADLAFVVRPGHRDDPVGLRDLDGRGHHHAQGAARPLHGHLAALDG